MSNCKTYDQIGGLKFSAKKRRRTRRVGGKRKSSKKHHRKRSTKHRGGSLGEVFTKLKSTMSTFGANAKGEVSGATKKIKNKL